MRKIRKGKSSYGFLKVATAWASLLLLGGSAQGLKVMEIQTYETANTTHDFHGGFIQTVKNFDTEIKKIDTNPVYKTYDYAGSFRGILSKSDFLNADGSKKFDIVTLIRITGAIPASDITILQTAIKERWANSFVFIIDGFDASSNNPTHSNIRKLFETTLGLTTGSITQGSITEKQQTYNLSSTGNYSEIFGIANSTSFQNMQGSSWVGINNKYSVFQDNINHAGLEGIFIPRQDSFAGSGACVFAMDDSTTFETWDNGDFYNGEGKSYDNVDLIGNKDKFYPLLQKMAASSYCGDTKPTTVKLVKNWVNATKGDTATVTATGGSNSNGTLDSTADSPNENGLDTASFTIKAGDTLTLSETLGSSNKGSYSAVYTCTDGGSFNTTTNKLTTTAADAGKTITCTVTNTLASTPTTPIPDCSTTVTGLLREKTGIWTKIAPLNLSTSPFTIGTTIANVPLSKFSNDNSNNNAALAVSQNGTYYVPTADDGLKIYDKGAWTTVTYPSNVTGKPIRATVDKNGILYFGYGTNMWSYKEGTFKYIPLSYTDNSGIKNNPPVISGSDKANGDFISDSQGNLYLVSNPDNATYLDIFKIVLNGTTTDNVTFMGRIKDLPSDSTDGNYTGIAALKDGIYVASTSGQVIKINMFDLTATQVSSTFSGTPNINRSYDLASCYYPDYTPSLKISKSATPYITVKPDPNTGNVSSVSPASITYTITVTNTGNIALGSTTVTDDLPSGLTYDEESARIVYSDASGNYPPSPGLEINNNGTATKLNFNIPGLLIAEPKKSAQITFTAKPTINTPNTGAFSNTASATAADLPSEPSKPAITDVIYTKLFKQVRNTKDNNWDSTATGLPGDKLEYCITAYNYGSVDLSNYKIADGVPFNTKAPESVAAGTSKATINSTVNNDTTWAGPNGTINVSGVVSTDPFVLGKGTNKTMCFQSTIK